MMKPEVRKSIEKSVLCWLATASTDGEPNVSPKEAFMPYGENSIIIANIASPTTVRNIQANSKVCVSFIDIFVQKGFQIKGTAEIVDQSFTDYPRMEQLLFELTQGKYPFKTITKIEINKIKPIIAPSYFLYPETTEEDQISSAMMTYGFSNKSL